MDDIAALKSKVAALEQLLEVFEQTTVDQALRLEDALRENETKSRQLLDAARERAQLAQERARALERELDIARQIQTSILPRSLNIDGLEIAARMLPADNVGGDYYDVIPVLEGCWLGIGDVSGHGLDAGLVMLMTQSIASAVANVHPTASPALVLRAVNSVLFENVRRRLLRDDYVTLTLLRYSRDGEIVYAGANEDILVCRADGRCEFVETPGPWVGAIADIERVTLDSTLQLGDGDVLLLYTDGVTEAMNARHQLFGPDRLLDVFRDSSRLAPDAIVQKVLTAVNDWSAKQADDITLLAARYTGRGQAPQA